MGRLTTHVLDTSAGRPAGGIRIELFWLDGGVREKLTEAVTNHDGRCDAPLLDDIEFRCGEFELLFEAGAYFEANGVTLPEPKFLDVGTIRFGVAAADHHYHVPLLMSPFGYSTYLGS